jgi:hypothetical protein
MMEWHLFIDPDSDHELVVRAKKQLGDAKFGRVDVFSFARNEFGMYALCWDPQLPPALRELPITAIHFDDEFRDLVPLGCHEEEDMKAWVKDTWRGDPIVLLRRVVIYGKDPDEILRLYREILAGKEPSKPQPHST